MPTIHVVDSFDFYATAQIPLFYETVNGSVIAAIGRNGTNGMAHFHNVSGPSKTIATGFATHYVGSSTKFNVAFGGRATLFTFFDTSTANIRDGVQVRIEWNGVSQKLEVHRGHPSAGTDALLATGTTVFSPGVERHVSVKVVISNTVGEVVVKVNGVTEINITGVDTQVTGNAWADRLGFGTDMVVFTASYELYTDDFWWNDYEDWGDVRVEARMPNGNGNLSNFAGSDGNSTDNYLLVDEVPPNSETDYVASATPGDIDLYAVQDLTPAAAVIKAVAVHLFARKDDAGARSIAPMVRNGSTNVAGATQVLGTSYKWYDTYYKDNPVTTNPWTLSEVNADEFGVKMVA